MNRLNKLLIRYGEISLKSDRVRSRFEKILIRNIKYVLDKESISYTITHLPLQGRIFVETDSPKKATDILSNVFGIVSISPTIRVSSELSNILEEALNLATIFIKNKNNFAIRVRRSGTHDYTSQEIANQAGALINKELKDRNIKVDLKNPDIIIFIEIRDKWAYIFKDIINGLGGLPYNSQGKLVSFFFGDLYSFLSIWLMLRKGCKIIPIFFDYSIFTSSDLKTQIVRVAQYLKNYVNSDNFYFYEIPDCIELVESNEYLKNINKFQICIQLMYFIAEKIADFESAQGIVVNNTFSEITNLQHLKKIEEKIKYPIFRPLLGLDEDKLSNLIKKIQKETFFDNKYNLINLYDESVIKNTNFTQIQINSIQEIVKYEIENAKLIKI